MGSTTVLSTVDNGTEQLERRFTYTIESINDAPQIANLALGTPANIPVVMAHATHNDTEENSLSFSITKTPNKGITQFNAENGTFTYHPPSNAHGIDHFEITAFDGNDYSSPARVSITITNDEADRPWIISQTPLTLHVQVTSSWDLLVEHDGELDIRTVNKPQDLSIEPHQGQQQRYATISLFAPLDPGQLIEFSIVVTDPESLHSDVQHHSILILEQEGFAQ